MVFVPKTKVLYALRCYVLIRLLRVRRHGEARNLARCPHLSLSMQ
jgi:hypothetical protein